MLAPYKGPSSRITCPDCRKPREFSKYIDQETGEILPDHVGRCNREEQCGYHYTPKQFFQDNEWNAPSLTTAPLVKADKPVQFLPLESVEPTLKHYDQNNFYLFLVKMFCETVAKSLCDKYLIGSSRHWKGANVFWQVDLNGNVRQSKVMLYNPENGRRVKSEQAANKYDHRTKIYIADENNGDKIYFAGKRILSDYEANLRQCFFGEHLIGQDKTKRICLVESEKTAIVATVYYPEYIWLATGGKNGCRWYEPSVFKALEGRATKLFPDVNQFDNWKEKAEQLRRRVNCNIVVEDVLEKFATTEQRSKGYDLADFLLKPDPHAGVALNHHGYPVIWDYINN
jgi:hypothetical protein